LARLRDWGVPRLFGYPGDGINGFLGALDRAGEPEFIQVRHEESSAFMACAHGKFTGQAGVCLATSGPGAIHLLNGLYDAKLDRQPVIALVGQQRRMSLGSSYQQEVNLPHLFADVSEYVETCMDPVQARHLLDRAMRIAIDRRTVSTLIFPNDVQELDAVESPPREHGAVFSSIGYERPRVIPSDSALARAAEVMNVGERVAILVGQGARGAEAELLETAELLGAGVAKAVLGKGVLPDRLPFVTGPIGLLGSRASYELMRGCDTLMIIGSSFPYAEWLPEEGQCRCVQIDIDAAMIGARVPAEVGLVGDSKETLRALLPLLLRKADRRWREEVEREVADWHATLDRSAHLGADPLNPQLVMRELSEHLPDHAIVTGDSGTTTVWLARQLMIREGMMTSLSGTLASMGSAVPYAIAAKLAYPGRPVVAVLGDGAFQMNGMNELLTVARYRSRLSDGPFVVCVFTNGDLNMVTWEQRALAGDPKFPASQDLPEFDAARFAELVGFRGIRVDRAEAIGPAWEEAFHGGAPTLIEALVDPEIPPLPPHVTIDQAKSMTGALLSGDPEASGVASKSLKSVLSTFVGRRAGK
jgi:pyruvate dehydrogenase (quinone)